MIETPDQTTIDIKEHCVVILCGGRGRRLGAIGDALPKALAPVRGKPVLWYIMMRLHMAGFRRFVLPLGYRGEDIRSFIQRDLANFDASIEAIDTGEETKIGRRLKMVRDHIKSDSFLMVNGDTLFDFDIADLVSRHACDKADLTLASCEILSQYGLLIIENNVVVDFSRGAPVRQFVVARPDGGSGAGFINAGIAVLRRSALDTEGVESTGAFEQYLYPKMIATGQVRHYHIDGFWHAIDTQKDLDIANSESDGDPRTLGTQRLLNDLTAYAARMGWG